jgi:hypothetical protein
MIASSGDGSATSERPDGAAVQGALDAECFSKIMVPNNVQFKEYLEKLAMNPDGGKGIRR